MSVASCTVLTADSVVELKTGKVLCQLVVITSARFSAV